MRLREQAHQIVLHAIGVLVFVNEQVRDAAVVVFSQGVVVAQQADRLEQQVVEVQGIGLQQAAFVLIPDRRQPLSFRIARLGAHVLRRLAVVLREADARERRAAGHEILLVQPQVTVNSLDDGELVVLVVDGEVGREAGSEFGQRPAVAAQDPDSERVERRDRQRAERIAAGQQRGHTFLHLVGGLVGEGHGYDGVGRHPTGGDQMGDAVRDDARLAAAGAGQNQQGTFAVLDGLALPVVESFEEIHELRGSGPGSDPSGAAAPASFHWTILARGARRTAIRGAASA